MTANADNIKHVPGSVLWLRSVIAEIPAIRRANDLAEDSRVMGVISASERDAIIKDGEAQLQRLIERKPEP